MRFQYSDGSYLPETSQLDESGKVSVKKYSCHKSTRYINVSDNQEGNVKQLPELYQSREQCCGCTACLAVCPKGAIEMLPDEEGFFYPVVYADKCIRCYKCLSVCAFKKA